MRSVLPKLSRALRPQRWRRWKSPWARLIKVLLLVLLSLLAALALRSCRTTGQTPLRRPAPLPQDPSIQVFFNQSESSEYRDPYGGPLRAGDDLEGVIVGAIAQAQTSIDLAVQELRLPRVAQALIERQRAGVRVRLVLENQYNQTLAEIDHRQLKDRDLARWESLRRFIDQDGDGQVSPSEVMARDAIAQLRQAKIPLLDDRADGSKGSGLMHHKFAIVDGRIIVTGSANFTVGGIHQEPTEPDSRGNVNHLLRIDSTDLARLFTEEFNLLWGDGPGGQLDSIFGVKKPVRGAKTVTVGTSSVTLQFSPTGRRVPWQGSSNGLIAKALAQATQQVDLALFVFSEQAIADVLQNLSQRGLAIRALIDPDFAFRPYSEALDLMGHQLTQNCKAEPDNRPWPRPLNSVGVPQLLPRDSLHHKFAVIDRRMVITGSHNWSKAANNQNDETVLIIQSPTVAAHFQREFERLYGNAVLGLPVKTQEKIAAERQLCGYSAGAAAGGAAGAGD